MNYVAEMSGIFEVCGEVYRKGMHSAGRRGTEKQGGTEQEHRGRGTGGGGKYRSPVSTATFSLSN